MPVITVSLYRGRSAAAKASICEAIQRSVKTALRIEHDNFHHRVHEYSPDEMLVPPVSTKNYVAIEIQFMLRRSASDKERLFLLIKDELNKLGIEDRDMIVFINDPPPENWFIRGKMGTEIVGK